MSGETEGPGEPNEIMPRQQNKILYPDGRVGFDKPQDASFFETERGDAAI